MGPKKKDGDVMHRFADTLLRLKLVWTYGMFSSRISPYIAMCHMDRIYWNKYREERKMDNI